MKTTFINVNFKSMPISKKTIKSAGSSASPKKSTTTPTKMSGSKPVPTKKRGYAEATVTAKKPVKNPNKVVTTTVMHPSNPHASMGVKLRVGAGEKVPAKMSSAEYKKYESRRVK